MIRKAPGIVIVLIALVVAAGPVAESAANASLDPTAAGARRWVRSPLIISFSSSLNSPPANIKPDSDVVGALRRALQSWEAVADIQFFETNSSAETISPSHQGDGVNLISVSTANAAMFDSSDAPARTRVFYDSGGTIVEADIALNPRAEFSTDGAPGTYDLESTFAHEIGHLLGLEHSAVIGATMQPRQARNGTYNLPAFSQRTLSEDDAAQARAFYGPSGAAIVGRVLTNISGRSRSIFGAHFYAEDVEGRVVASGVSSAAGQYRVEGLRAGVYRIFAQPLNGLITPLEMGVDGNAGSIETTPFRSFIASNSTPSLSLNVSSNSVRRLGFFVLSVGPSLTPRLIGMNGELCTTPLPLRAGETVTVYLAGEGLDEVPLEGISISSALIRVVADSLRAAEFEVPYRVISFEISLDEQLQPGDYTIRLQSRDGELAFVPGAITVDNP